MAMANRASLVQILSAAAVVGLFASCAPNDERSFRTKPNPERSAQVLRAKAEAEERARKQAQDKIGNEKQEASPAGQAGGNGSASGGGGGGGGTPNGPSTGGRPGGGTLPTGTSLGDPGSIQLQPPPTGRGEATDVEAIRKQFNTYLQDARDYEVKNPGSALNVIRGLSVNVTLFKNQSDAASCEGSVPCLNIELLALLGIESDPIKTISRQVVKLVDGKAPYKIFEMKVLKQSGEGGEVPGSFVRLLCDNEKCTDIWVVYYAQAAGKGAPEIAAYNFVPDRALNTGEYVDRASVAMKINLETQAPLAGRKKTTVGDSFIGYEEALNTVSVDQAAAAARLAAGNRQATSSNADQLREREGIIKTLFDNEMAKAKQIPAASVTAAIEGLSTFVQPASGRSCSDHNHSPAASGSSGGALDESLPGYCIEVKANLVLDGKKEVAISRGILQVRDGVPVDNAFRSFVTRDTSPEKKVINVVTVFIACLDNECKEVYVDYHVKDVRGVYVFIKQGDDPEAKQLVFKLENGVPISSIGKDAKPFVAPPPPGAAAPAPQPPPDGGSGGSSSAPPRPTPAGGSPPPPPRPPERSWGDVFLSIIPGVQL